VSVVYAVFKRNLAGFFGNPAGYVFIILFVLLTAWFAFVSDEFFANNQANLDPLTRQMPWLLMIFVASVTMSTWAEERKLGTDELLFTLPSGDLPVVVGKFLASLAVFTAALLFTLSHVFILCHLGNPDLGLLFATYLGYWLMGAAFIATGMFASSLTSNITVGFILGALFCAVFASAQVLAVFIPGRIGSGINELAAVTHMDSFARGVVALKDVIYFLSITAAMLFLNSAVLAKRRWPGGIIRAGADPRVHTALRIAAVIVIAISINVLSNRFGGRFDISNEKLSSLSEETKQILAGLDADKPVYIQAWISKEVPPFYVETRDSLVGLLKEYDALGGDAVRVKIYHPERYSQEARDAKDKFNITPQVIPTLEGAEAALDEIFAGAAFICGTEEEVIPFFIPTIPIEYELTRTIRVVNNADRPKVGVVENELKLFGGFNFETYSPDRRWAIVEELSKQYEIDTIRADTPIPDDVDVVLAAMPSLLTDEKLDNLIAAIRSGKKALILTDPLPWRMLDFSPRLPRPSPQSNPMMGRQPPGDPKCDLSKLMDLLGVNWSDSLVVWDIVNPHPELRHLSPEFVFVTDSLMTNVGFNADEQVSSGLQEVIALFPGSLRKTGAPGANLTFEPLITTSVNSSGTIAWDNLVGRSFFGHALQPLERLKSLPRRASPQNYILAARIQGTLPADDKAPGDDEASSDEKEKEPASTSEIDVILVADCDMISDSIFAIRQEGRFEFDNVPFILNCVDALAGDDSYIKLRKKRKLFRTLTTIEALEEQHREKTTKEQEAADLYAKQQLADAQRSFDDKVRAVEERADLDMRAKEIMIASVKRVEEGRLAAQREKIEEEKGKKIESSLFAMRQEISKIHSEKKAMAMVLPILPPLIIAILVYFIRRKRENRGAAQSRLLRD